MPGLFAYPESFHAVTVHNTLLSYHCQRYGIRSSFSSRDVMAQPNFYDLLDERRCIITVSSPTTVITAPTPIHLNV